MPLTKHNAAKSNAGRDRKGEIYLSRPSARTTPRPAAPVTPKRDRPRRPPALNTRRQRRGLHDLVDDVGKRLAHVLARQRADLGEERAVFLGQRAALLGRDLAALGSFVELGANLCVLLLGSPWF